jgi:hypothetical protein
MAVVVQRVVSPTQLDRHWIGLRLEQQIARIGERRRVREEFVEVEEEGAVVVRHVVVVRVDVDGDDSNG